MTRFRGRGTRVVTLLVVAVAAAGMLAVVVRDDRDAPPPPAVPDASADDSLASNQITLSAADSRRLLRWATRFRECVVATGVSVAAPVVTRKQISMRPQESPGPASLMATIAQCGGQLGDPPRDSSLQLVRGGLIVLYLPKQCLLDPTVAGEDAS